MHRAVKGPLCQEGGRPRHPRHRVSQRGKSRGQRPDRAGDAPGDEVPGPANLVTHLVTTTPAVLACRFIRPGDEVTR